MSRNPVIRIPRASADVPSPAPKRVDFRTDELDSTEPPERRRTTPTSLGAFEQG